MFNLPRRSILAFALCCGALCSVAHARPAATTSLRWQDPTRATFGGTVKVVRPGQQGNVRREETAPLPATLEAKRNGDSFTMWLTKRAISPGVPRPTTTKRSGLIAKELVAVDGSVTLRVTFGKLSVGTFRFSSTGDMSSIVDSSLTPAPKSQVRELELFTTTGLQ